MRVSRIAIALLGSILVAGVAQSAIINVPGDQPTIQDGINAAGPGDTINLVNAGVYSETGINVDETVTIVGQGLGVTKIDPGPAGIGMFILADGVTISDLTIENGSQGIRFFLDGGTIDSTTLTRVELLNHSSRGIEIHNNTTVTNLLIDECDFESVKTGLRVSSSAHVDGIEFRDSTFLSNDLGIYEANDGSVSTLKNMLVTGCTFTDHTTAYGSQGTVIFLEEVQDALIENNTFVDNRRDIQIFKWYQAAVPVSNVVIRDNTSTGSTSGCLALFNAEHASGQTEFAGITYENNTCATGAGAARAIYAGGHSTDPSTGGIGWDTVHINCNDFTGPHTLGVDYWDPGGEDADTLGGDSLDVTNNWWGTSDPGTVASLMDVPAITTHDPFLGSPFDVNCPPPSGVPASSGFGLGALGLGLLVALSLVLIFPFARARGA